MRKLIDGKLSAITAVLLTVLAVGITTVCFLPERTAIITGGKAIEPIYHGDKNGDAVCLMVNVYEGGDIVEEMLGVLDEYGAKATFFVGGCWADDNGEILIKILEKGHEIGNHGYFHKDHAKLGEKANREEIDANYALVKRLTGYEMKYFAPPSGSFSPTTLKVAEKLGYKTIMWTKDTIDWRDSDLNKIISRATDNLSAGDLILMHPKKHTLAALPKILDFYANKGLRAVTLSECINGKS
ncbi:MAG: polysaccharide deacetylase family protein [Clostridia bacterium]|nr:polysaccharide deacetylase family protein [Clostridia bacterium]